MGLGARFDTSDQSIKRGGLIALRTIPSTGPQTMYSLVRTRLILPFRGLAPCVYVYHLKRPFAPNRSILVLVVAESTHGRPPTFPTRDDSPLAWPAVYHESGGGGEPVAEIHRGPLGDLASEWRSKST